MNTKRVGELIPGDVLAVGVIIGFDRIGKGGWRFNVRRADGSVGTAVFDARRKVEVIQTLAELAEAGEL